MPEVTDDILHELEIEEGTKGQVYYDSLGFATIGIGRCIDPRVPGAGLSRAEQLWLLTNDVTRLRSALRNELPWTDTLSVPRRNVLLQLAFENGVEGLLKFNKFLKLVMGGFYIDAAADLLTTLVAKQAPNRIKRLADQMRTGVSQYPQAPTQSNFKPTEIH